jgi:hypothetical protein
VGRLRHSLGFQLSSYFGWDPVWCRSRRGEATPALLDVLTFGEFANSQFKVFRNFQCMLLAPFRLRATGIADALVQDALRSPHSRRKMQAAQPRRCYTVCHFRVCGAGPCNFNPLTSRTSST